MINANRCPQSAKQDIVLKHVLNTLYYTVESLFVCDFFLLKLSIIFAATAEVDKEKQ